MIASPGFKIGTNVKINLDGEKDKPDVKSIKVEILKTKLNIESDKEHTQDVKHNIGFNKESKPDINKITYEEGSFGIGNNIYLYCYVDVQMTYLLLVFVMKYV